MTPRGSFLCSLSFEVSFPPPQLGGDFPGLIFQDVKKPGCFYFFLLPPVFFGGFGFVGFF